MTAFDDFIRNLYIFIFIITLILGSAILFILADLLIRYIQGEPDNRVYYMMQKEMGS